MICQLLGIGVKFEEEEKTLILFVSLSSFLHLIL